jgi:hypothetical protein
MTGYLSVAAAVLVPVTPILVRAAGRLDHAVEHDVLEGDNPSHRSQLPELSRKVASIP